MTDPGVKRRRGRGASVWLVAGVALLAGACGGSRGSEAPQAATSPSVSAAPSTPATAGPRGIAPSPEPRYGGQPPVVSSPSATATAPAAAGLTKTLTFGRITFSVPKDWDVDVDGADADTAYVGMLAGGPQDVMLRVERNAAGPIDALKPEGCPHEGDAPEPATSVVTVEQGLRPVGDRNAEYRRWKVTCPGGSTKEHRAWFLPTSRIAIYEQVYDPHNAAVVANAKIR